MAETHNDGPESVPMNHTDADGIDLGEALFDDLRQRTTSWDPIDWERTIETPDDVV